MRLQWLRADIASARRATTFLALLLTASLFANAVLALLTVRLAGRERVVLVPPTIHKTFWVESDRVSGEYLEQMAYFLMQLTLDGFALSRRLRADMRTASLPIIMITAADDRHRDEAASVGVDRVLGKPYADEDLIACIESTLETATEEEALNVA